jgi:hypothetical protein
MKKALLIILFVLVMLIGVATLILMGVWAGMKPFNWDMTYLLAIMGVLGFVFFMGGLIATILVATEYEVR